MRISVYGSRELQATILALGTLNTTVKREIRGRTKSMAVIAWQQELAGQASTELEQAVLVRTARVRVSDQNVSLTSATVGRRLPGGLNPKDDNAGVEFGAGQRKVRYQARSTRGRTFTVNRNTRAQLRPRNRKGYVVYPAAAQIIPRIAALWTQTVARTLYDALEGRR